MENQYPLFRLKRFFYKFLIISGNKKYEALKGQIFLE